MPCKRLQGGKTIVKSCCVWTILQQFRTLIGWGPRSHALNELAIKIARWWGYAKNISLQVEHLPGVLNVIADRESCGGIYWTRLVTASGGLQRLDGNMANGGRPIFEPLERAAQNICQLECTTRSVGDECVFIELEINDGLCATPPFL
jgi:hypothetical protein